MDALLAELARLLGVFRDPVNVVLLLVSIAEGAAIYRLVRFFMDRSDKDLEGRIKLATALEGLEEIIREKLSNAKNP